MHQISKMKTVGLSDTICKLKTKQTDKKPYEAEKNDRTEEDWERERERENLNSNSKTLFYKDCSLGSFKNLSNN